MAVFFTSDTHFGDMRALRFDHRPFPDLDTHDAELIARWNAVVGPDDEIWHLGDFALGPPQERVREILAALNGRKHLIVGNNDGPDTLAAPGWESIGHYAEIEVDDRPLVLCHYAFRTWNGMSRGRLDLHGHSHGKLKKITGQYDVGVDVWDFRPVSLSTVVTTRRRRSPANENVASR
ncbi:Calcineurin-like phosphoesterase superfamily protein [Faunimonas pinastri]|uniref:Calcineurin-like phosphoesterase superfamily protein n=1 Tax=Faunimonas pinastri TaxID=1855383 RepID=A0A1H9ARH3_9HYPH|nr:metallophosphoesterase family protein [Faunimonas pinastri]SEP79057.1 Calcineurin-like phosphoesterase superfamily protein [Faunimonas pinastri]